MMRDVFGLGMIAPGQLRERVDVGGVVRSDDRREVALALMDALRVRSPAAHAQAVAIVPAYALENREATWWRRESASLISSLVESLDEAAPEGYGFWQDETTGVYGFWREEDR